MEFRELGMKDKEIEPEKALADGEEFLNKVDLDDFDVDVMPDGLRVLITDNERTQKLEDHLFETDENFKDLKTVRGL